jgi:hypothetical protein
MRKTGSPRQQSIYTCVRCIPHHIFKKYKYLFLQHMKESHGIEV